MTAPAHTHRRAATTQVEILRGWSGYPAGATPRIAVHLADELVRLKIARRLTDPRPSPAPELPPAPGPAREPEVTRDPASQARASGGDVKQSGKRRKRKGSRGHSS